MTGHPSFITTTESWQHHYSRGANSVLFLDIVWGASHAPCKSPAVERTSIVTPELKKQLVGLLTTELERKIMCHPAKVTWGEMVQYLLQGLKVV